MFASSLVFALLSYCEYNSEELQIDRMGKAAYYLMDSTYLDWHYQTDLLETVGEQSVWVLMRKEFVQAESHDREHSA